MIPFQKSIAFRILGVSFILLALPLLVDSFVLVQKRYTQTIIDAKDSLVEMASLREVPFSQLQPLDRSLIELLVYYLQLEGHFPEKPNKELEKKLQGISQVGEFYGIFIIKLTEDGQYIVIDSNKEEYIGRDYTNFLKLYNLYDPSAIESGYSTYISFDDETLHPYFIVIHPIYSLKENRTVGLLAVSDDITLKMKELLRTERGQYTINFALLLPSTVVFAASDPDLKFHYFLPLGDEAEKLFQKEQKEVAKYLPEEPLPVTDEIGYPFFEFSWKGQAQIGYIKKLSDASFSLLTYASKDDIFQTPLIAFFNTYTIYGFILVLGGTFATILTMRMAKPIQDLSLVMHKIQSGNLNVRYKKDPLGFEINSLGEIFNEMVDAVLEQKHVAEEERVKRETFAQELKLGQQVQRSLLPQTMPSYPGVEVAEIYIPAIEVGGDFYDVFVTDGKHSMKLVLAIADASGKGVQACFYSLSVRNMLRTYAKEYSDISDAMVATSNLFRRDTADTGMFVTVLAGTYDCQTRIFRYFSCGHNPGFILRAGGEIEILQFFGTAMGVLQADPAASVAIQVQKGDFIVFYTDGITEAHNEFYELYGEERLKECLSICVHKTAAEMVASIVDSVTRFVGKAPQHDDITLLVMKIVE
jgi:phosphoserine phosphatase RsbU/P